MILVKEVLVKNGRRAGDVITARHNLSQAADRRDYGAI
jgi:hypothetical protein